MFKRAIWMGTGFGLGVTSSVWMKRAVRRRVHRYAPERVRRQVTTRARRVQRDVTHALAEGRQAMRDYRADAEAELTAQQRRRTIRAVGD